MLLYSSQRINSSSYYSENTSSTKDEPNFTDEAEERLETILERWSTWLVILMVQEDRDSIFDLPEEVVNDVQKSTGF